jgi:hypothetical protein
MRGPRWFIDGPQTCLSGSEDRTRGLRTRIAMLTLGSGLGAAILPAVADAHLVTTGMGPLCDGVAHFCASPEDYLPVVILGLFAGLRGPRQTRLTLAALTLAWLVGGLASFVIPFAASNLLVIATALLFVLLGGLLAWNPDTPSWVIVGIGLSIGLIRGLDDLRSAPPQLPTAAVLGSICGCVLVVYALAASVTLPLKRLWMIVAVRVGGSWMAAIGLLLAGWIIRYGNQIAR